MDDNARDYELVTNAAGRLVPTRVNGRPVEPYQGVYAHRPSGRTAAPPIPTCAQYPRDGNKVVADLQTALRRCGLRDGMTISTHHHFRNGDVVANQVFDLAAGMGVRELRWFPSASFPCHEPVIRHMDSGVVHHIEGSLNGPLGEYCSRGKMAGMGVLRSHGGRYRAIQDGDAHIDIAVLAAPAADAFGNANGLYGPSACGPLGYTHADYRYADRVIVVTDNLVEWPCHPWDIIGNYVDYVVVQDSVGNPNKIVSGGTTEITTDPERLRMAETVAHFLDHAGLLHDGFNFQAGAGGTSLAFVKFLRDLLQEKGMRARAMSGGTTGFLVDILEEGMADYILDGQSFDLEAIRSLRDNPRHLAYDVMQAYNFHAKGNSTFMMDAIVLGATEVDVDFNANVVTHSDGKLLHGIGGWQNSLFAQCTILTIPALRRGTPMIRDRVTTLVGPGELVDVVVTERGIAINPRRTDLVEATSHSDLPIRPLRELKEEAEDICGCTAPEAELTRRVVAVVEWVDGTVLDSIWQLPED
ncbi:MAG TPA: citrate lyase subunit alpha [Thermoplasmatales archaeon]|nr:citrate lyase subunit alpha [Thermoplasmatales archaeon]